MLVLGRKINESIVLEGKDGKIYIKIVRGKQADANNLKIAIEAPKDVKVIRGEFDPDIEDMEARWAARLGG